MAKRIATIMAPKDLGAAGTEVIDIKARDVITSIYILFKAVNVTVSVMLDAVTACLQKIELVDGSEVLGSVTGAELQAVNFYDRLKMPHHEISLTVGGMFEVGLSMDFGRYLWDPVYAFDPTKFVNPQLRITWDEDACNTSAVVNECAVYAYAFGEGGPMPTGMIVNREVKSYAMAASSHEYSDLPVDRQIRKLIIRGYSTDHDPITLFDTLKISIDDEKIVPVNIKADQLDRILTSMYPRITERYTLDAVVTAKTIYSSLSMDQTIQVNYDATAFVTAQSKFAVATWTGAKCALSASVDIQAANAIVNGRMPANCFPIDFGEPNNPESWLQAQNYGSIETDLYSSSDADSGDTASIVVQQAMIY